MNSSGMFVHQLKFVDTHCKCSCFGNRFTPMPVRDVQLLNWFRIRVLSVVSGIAVDKSSSSGLLHCIIEVKIPDVLKNCSAFIFGVRESKKKYILVLFFLYLSFHASQVYYIFFFSSCRPVACLFQCVSPSFHRSTSVSLPFRHSVAHFPY